MGPDSQFGNRRCIPRGTLPSDLPLYTPPPRNLRQTLCWFVFRLVSLEDSILKVREENSVKYQRAFLGCEMVDWLVQEGEAVSRSEATELCQTLLEHGIIQHGRREELVGRGGEGRGQGGNIREFPLGRGLRDEPGRSDLLMQQWKMGRLVSQQHRLCHFRRQGECAVFLKVKKLYMFFY